MENIWYLLCHAREIQHIAAFFTDRGFFTSTKKEDMERDEQQLSGWRKFRFNYGSMDVKNLPFADEDEDYDSVCTQERVGSGCYVATVDYDRLDQQ